MRLSAARSAWPLAVAELTHTTTPQAPAPIQRNPPFANPPYAPAPMVSRDLPVGRKCVRSSSFLPPLQALSAAKSVAPKNQFQPRFQVDDPCPDLARKIFRFAIR
jgi:hypothetical protein